MILVSASISYIEIAVRCTANGQTINPALVSMLCACMLMRTAQLYCVLVFLGFQISKPVMSLKSRRVARHSSSISNLPWM